VRLWSLHPQYLDAKGLVAAWREGLLARAVLRGETKGYGHHPQLHRFREHPSPRRAIDAWLAGIHAEATARGYSFDRSKIGPLRKLTPIPVTRGQLAYEWAHLLRKLARRAPAQLEIVRQVKRPRCHPLLRSRPGPIAAWEKVGAPPKPTRRRPRKR